MDQKTVIKALNGSRVRFFMLLSFAALILFSTIEFASSLQVRSEYGMKDYDAFYVAGRMYWESRILDAYYADRLFLAQHEIVGSQSFMPWTYPPHFNFLTAILATLPVWLGYLIFISTTLILYILVLRRISPSHFSMALLITFPAAVICIRTGQNGFLIPTAL